MCVYIYIYTHINMYTHTYVCTHVYNIYTEGALRPLESIHCPRRENHLLAARRSPQTKADVRYRQRICYIMECHISNIV